jgi:hypothetical protein
LIRNWLPLRSLIRRDAYYGSAAAEFVAQRVLIAKIKARSAKYGRANDGRHRARGSRPLDFSPDNAMVNLVGRIGFVIVILLALVGIMSAVGRFAATVGYLADPTSIRTPSADAPAGPNFDNRYYAHPYWTLSHVTAGFLFMTLGPLQFVAAVRNR